MPGPDVPSDYDPAARGILFRHESDKDDEATCTSISMFDGFELRVAFEPGEPHYREW